MVLDIVLPGLDGWAVCQEIRAHGSTPVIIITARGQEKDRLLGLGLGADDYLVKPFSVPELAARIRTVLRRTGAAAAREDRLAFGALVIDLSTSQVQLDGPPVQLTSTEFRLLATLARRPGRVFSRLHLLEAAFGGRGKGSLRAVDTHISNLRRKLEPTPDSPSRIQTVHGLGYRFAREIE